MTLALQSFSAAALVAAAVSAAHAETYDAHSVAIERFVGVIDIQTGGVDSVTIDYDPGRGLIDAPTFEVDGDTVEIRQIGRFTKLDCDTRGGVMRVKVGRRGSSEPIDDYGTLTLANSTGSRPEPRLSWRSGRKLALLPLKC